MQHAPLTRRLYQERIRLVQDHIDSHLSQALDMATLARVAGFSPHHFHRIFHAFTGETPAEAVRSRRLAAAAGLLRYRQRVTVEQIALACGFSSLSDFSRSFRRAYGLSPTAWRRQRQMQVSEGILHARKETVVADLSCAVKVLNLPDFHAACLRCRGLSPDWETDAVKAAWKRLITWASARDLIGPETRFIGLTLDHPELLPFADCRYDACITVPPGTAADGEIGVRALGTAGKYASVPFRRGSPEFAEELYRTMDMLYGQWLPDNGYEPDFKPFLELWGAGDSPGEVRLTFCVPIKPYGT